MSDPSQSSDIAVTELLQAWNAGDESARAQVLAFAYQQVHRIAKNAIRAASGATLSPTELCNEALIKLMQAAPDYVDRKHFFGICAQAVRQVLVDSARKRLTEKRGAQPQRVPLDAVAEPAASPDHTDERFLKLDAAINQLAIEQPRRAELIELVYFGGFTQVELTESMQVSISTIERDLRLARAWLKTLMLE